MNIKICVQYVLAFVLLHSVTALAASVSIKAPPIAENGAVVPVTINISPSLSPGQVLKIYSNGHLASTVNAKDFDITMFITRIRMLHSGNIEVNVSDQGGNIIAATSALIKVTIGAMIPRSASGHVRQRVRSRGSVLKALFTNKMAIDGHIKQFNFNTGIGQLTVNSTPYMSQNPYIGFRATQGLGSVSIATRTGTGVADMAPTTNMSPRNSVCDDQDSGLSPGGC